MYRFALAQINTNHHFEENLTKVIQMIGDAKKQGADAVLFPESFLLIGKSPADYQKIAEPMDGPTISKFKELAKNLEIEIFLGGYPEICESHPTKNYNTALWIDKKGKILSVYRKIHLFESNLPGVNLHESDSIEAGTELKVIDHPTCKIGITICYDLRFPTLFQRLRMQGAEVILVPAAFTQQTGIHHWLPLLQARAIENQVYILAPAQTGNHNEKRSSFGHTVAIDPWGMITAIKEEGEGLVFAEFDREKIETIRETMPIFEHRINPMDQLTELK